MSNEVELKLAVTSDAFDTLKIHLNQFKILEQNKVFGETKNGIACSSGK